MNLLDQLSSTENPQDSLIALRMKQAAAAAAWVNFSPLSSFFPFLPAEEKER